MKRHLTRLLIPVAAMLLLPLAAVAVACGGGDDAPPPPTAEPTLSAAAAEAALEAIVLKASDIGDDYTQDVARVQTNEEAALARPDTDNARTQFEEWGQVLAYNVQYAAPPTADLIFNAKTARMMNTVTLFRTPEGAAAALTFLRDLPPEIVETLLDEDDGETQLSDTIVTKDIEFAAKGDESFAWRVSGKATLPGDFVVNYVADVVWVRSSNTNGNVITVALGQPPDRAELEGLVDLFLTRAQAGAS